MLESTFRSAAVLAVAAMVHAASAAAQSPAGTIQGTVVGPTGMPLEGATVTVTSTDTGAERETATGSDGFFAAPNLPPGPYEVAAVRPGLAMQRQSSARVHVGRTLTLRLELRAAPAAETITEAGTPSLIEPSRSHVSTLLEPAAVAHLPVRDRNVLDFVLVTPAVTRRGRTGSISFAGQHDTLNRVMIDGADPIGIRFAQEAVRELAVLLNAYPAEYGRGGAGIVHVVTKSGTNRLGGSLFGSYGDEWLTTNTAPNERLGRANPPHDFSQFGGAAGGPIVRDEHFFFGAYEGLRAASEQQVFLNLPPDTPGDADTQAAIARLQRLADPWERTRNQDVFFARTDHHVAGVHQLTLRYDQQAFTGAGGGRAGPQTSFQAAATSDVGRRSFGAALASAVGPGLFNHARFRYGAGRDRREPHDDRPQAVIRQGPATVLTIGRSPWGLRDTTIDRFQVADTLTWVRGAHTVKGGVDLLFDRVVDDFPAGTAGMYVFDTLAAFTRGVPDGAGGAYTQAFEGFGTAGETRASETADYSFFVQDEWRAGPAFTVNAGMRYDLQAFGSPGAPDADTNNVGPRLGIVWAPADREFLVRGGYGLVYGRTPSRLPGMAQAYNGVNLQTMTFRGASGDPVPAYPGRFASIPPAAPLPAIVAFDAGYANPRVQQGSAGVEWEWMRDTSLSVNYLFVQGSGLPRWTDLNVGPPEPATFTVVDAAGAATGTVQHYRFAPGPFTSTSRAISIQSTAESRYDGVTVELRRRFAQNRYYRLAYTLGRVEDTMPGTGVLVPGSANDRTLAPRPADLEADRAPGDSDRRHRVAGAAVYDTTGFADRFDGLARSLLEAWTLSAVYVAQSGRPYSAWVNADVNRDGNRFNDLAPGTTRNQFRLPAWFSLDARAAREIGLGGRARLTVIWEGFNLLNTLNAAAVDDTLYDVRGAVLRLNPLFGQATAHAEPRTMRLAAKLSF